MSKRYLVGAVLAGLSLSTLAAEDKGSELAALAAEAASLEARIAQLEDEKSIERLQRIFGFYIDEQLWTQAADLFTKDATLEIGGSGVYVGRERILAYLHSLGEEGPQYGVLNDHMQLMPVIHVADDGSAQGRWHHFSQEAVLGESHHWGTGIYENHYRKEDGVWKISALQLFSSMRSPYDDGWAITALPRSEASRELPPDRPPSVDYDNYPAVFVAPFHYDNPVSGAERARPAAAQPVAVDAQTLQDALDGLAHRAERLEDLDAIERLHSVYGYYLARNQWDELAGIFSPEGTIEIALRGVYKGRAGVRRNLDLYGVQGELPGELHNHMQFQPVIHVAEDGNNAQMRSRALSMMGSFGGVGRWMGGVYENTFRKIDGVWMLHTDQVFNTYFASYDEGWKELEFRPAPGLTEANPPDAPPSTYFEMYPSPFLPPFHYANPVSGRVTVWERPYPAPGEGSADAAE